MSNGKLHANEVPIDASLVRSLLAEQFDHWADLPLTRLTSSGTVNAVFRLGSDMCVRLPRIKEWVPGLLREMRWLPVLAARISLAIPMPLAAGRPSAKFPFTWAIYRWLPGRTLGNHAFTDEQRAARELAHFIGELKQIDTTGAPRSGRDRPLKARDAETRQALAAARGLIDTGAAQAAWDITRQAPAWTGDPVWTHGDLLPPNLLVRDGQLSAIIDFGNSGVGDPAVDAIAAWSVFGHHARQTFRAALDIDDGTWLRSRGFALHQALLIIPYYQKTNPNFTAMAIRTVSEIIADFTTSI